MNKVDIYLANLLVGNVSLHNLHWNVVGSQFKAVHEYLEAIYDDFFAKFDEVAEYQKQSGVYPKASVKEYLALTSLTELETKDYSVKDAIALALAMLNEQKQLALAIREDADDSDFILANMMEDHVAGYNKQIWFMESMLK